MEKNFIKAGTEYSTREKHIPAPFFRKTFEVFEEIKSANLRICALGFYALYINAAEITKGFLAPYVSNPDHICYYDDYDVSDYLHIGKNVIGIILGNGNLNAVGGQVWDFDKAPYRDSPKMILELRLKFINGSEKTIDVSDFKVHNSPILFDDLRLGEYYDANLEIDGWNTEEYDDSDWKYAVEAAQPRGELKKCECEPIKMQNMIKPIRIVKNDNGFLYDFGINSSGVCKLTGNFEHNQKIILKYGELVDEDNNLDRSSITFDSEDVKYFVENNQIDTYVAKGKGTESHISRFTFHGFRYVEVLGINDKQATDELLEFYELSSDMKTVGDFDCSDENANKLFSMAKRSDRSNFYYFPLDCPHREKNGWTGDIALSAEHMMYIYDTEKSFCEWLNNARKSQRDEGDIPGVIPTDTWGYGEGPNWDKALFELPYQICRLCDNTDVIRDNAQAMILYLKFIKNHERTDEGLLCFGLGDWLQVGRICYIYDVPLEVCTEIAVIDIAQKAYEMFEKVNDREKTEFARDIYNNERRLVREKLIDLESGIVRGNTQTGQALTLYYNIFEKSEEEKAVEYLVRLIHDNDDRFNCGILGMRTMFHVLSKHGYGDLAYDLIMKKGYPSYYHFIESGETSLPESFMPDGESCGSHNHHFLGDISRWFINSVAGLEMIDSKNAIISPCFIKKIGYASAWHQTKYGKIEVFWKRENRVIKLDIKTSGDIKYKIELPPKFIYKNGTVKEV